MSSSRNPKKALIISHPAMLHLYIHVHTPQLQTWRTTPNQERGVNTEWYLDTRTFTYYFITYFYRKSVARKKHSMCAKNQSRNSFSLVPSRQQAVSNSHHRAEGHNLRALSPSRVRSDSSQAGRRFVSTSVRDLLMWLEM